MKIYVNCDTITEKLIKRMVKEIAEKVLKKFNLDSILSIVITDDRAVRKLNQKYRKINRATDVLSFEMDGRAGGGYLGDLVISLPAVKRNSQRYKVTPECEMRRIVVHGILHLLGYEHGVVMSKMEEGIVKIL